ncbi:MAG TPA: DHA2 family efflux MFS transporter permease subunit, partial [Candidatus Eisenbacteria bacterium]|nr:DHA2 family efflux MFS transporter permease subunit [Candidatus Eisenbacteria bacterium]
SLGLAAVIPLTGWLADRYGTKRVFLVSQVLFTLSSMLCGLAWSNPSLIAFRVVQGLAGGLIMPVGMTILMTVSRPDERGRMMAVLGLPMLVAPVLGPVLGGWLVQYVSWRLIFYVNVPIGIAGAVMTALLLRGPAGEGRRQRLDAAGLTLGVPAVVAVVYGLSQPGQYGWASAHTLLPLLGGTAGLVAFCLYELRTPAPLIEIRVFRDAAFSAAMTLNFLIGVALFGSVVLVPLFLQQVQGYGALDSGVVLAAQGLAAAAAMPIGGLLTDRLGARQVVPFGLALLTLSSVWMATLAVDTPRWEVAAMVAGRGLGIGMSLMPAMSSAYVTLPPGLIARATSVSNTVQRVAGALAVAIVTTILADRVTVETAGRAAAKAVVLARVARGYDDTFWVTVGLSLVCFPMALLLRRSLRPDVVRAHALRLLAEGVILGAAARRLATGNGIASLDPVAARATLAGGARSRLERGFQALRAGTSASGLVPLAPLSPAVWALFAIVLVVALIGTVLAVLHGYQAPSAPRPPGPA